MTVSSVSPSTATIPAGGKTTVVYSITGKPTKRGVVYGRWNKEDLTCNDKTDVRSSAKIGYVYSYSVGSDSYKRADLQFKNIENYGPNGTFNGRNSSFDGFAEFKDLTPDISYMTVEEMLEYDMINIGPDGSLSSENSVKLKEYVERGGTTIVICEQNAGNNILDAFGAKGTISTTSTTTAGLYIEADEINDVFGSPNNSTVLTGRLQLFPCLQRNLLPDDSNVFAYSYKATATTDTDDVMGFSTANRRAIFLFSRYIIRSQNAGASSDNDKSVDTYTRYYNNIMAYLLRKAGF